MGVRRGEPSPILPPGPAASGLASVQGPRIISRPDTEVSYGDETQSK